MQRFGPTGPARKHSRYPAEATAGRRYRQAGTRDDHRNLFRRGGELCPKIGLRTFRQTAELRAGAFTIGVAHDQIFFLVRVVDQVNAADLVAVSSFGLVVLKLAMEADALVRIVDQLKAQRHRVGLIALQILNEDAEAGLVALCLELGRDGRRRDDDDQTDCEWTIAKQPHFPLRRVSVRSWRIACNVRFCRSRTGAPSKFSADGGRAAS